MKNKQLEILLIFLFSSVISYASGRDSIRTTDIIDRSLQREEYFSTFAKVPSLLWIWDKPDYALILTDFSSAKGSYTHPQLLFSRNQLEIKTESIKSIPTKGWRFFGSVAYTNGSAETGKWNMSYYLPSNGSPYYYMIEQQGTWKTQSYDFNVAMQKNLSGKLSSGISIKYLGDLTFRTFDSRNDNSTLEMQILPSLTYRLGEKNFVSLGLLFNRIKNESLISNKYQHGTEPEKYHLFFNQGLGTWDNSPTTMRMVDAQYGVVASWRRIMKTSTLDLIYSMHTGSEDWLLKSLSTLLDRKENVSHYSSFSQDLALRYKYLRKSGYWISNLDVRNVFGTGSIFKVPANVFQDNYEARIVRANLYVAYLKNKSLLKRVSANVNFDNSAQNDFNYGHTIDYSNLESTIAADLSFGKRRNSGFILGGFASYKINLYGDHSPMAAANNFYTTDIVVPAFAYLTSDNYKFGLKLGAEFNLAKTYNFEILFKGDYTKPISIKQYENFANFSLKDKYLNVYFSICFNF